MFLRCVLLVLVVVPLLSCYGMEDKDKPKQEEWSFDGVFGRFDFQSIQRGLVVYKEVCSACHGVKRVAFRNLEEIGFSKDEVAVIASEYQMEDGPNDDGEMFERPGKASDYFPDPYPNSEAAKAANNGALPPDLSLIIKARQDGANYVYSLLAGYVDPPEDVNLQEGLYYNPYFGNRQISMSPPLQDGMVDFADGTEATLNQMSRDVVNFLQWASEPEMERRKKFGLKSVSFMIVFTILFIVSKKRIWSRLYR